MPDDILKDALERFDYSQSGSAALRQAAQEDWRFARLGMQWPDAAKRQREIENRPCLTVNRMPTFIRQVVNDGRQNKPSISVHPVDGGADVGTAEVIGGLIRAVERGSNAALAYDHGLDCAATCGFGFFRILTDYIHPESFDQEARIERVMNPFSVHWDVDSVAFDASDWNYAFVSDLLTKAEFERRFPKADAASWEAGSGEQFQHWTEGDKVRVAEYWTREEQKETILRLTDGRVIRPADLDRPMPLGPGITLPMRDVLALGNISVNGERETILHKVRRRLLNGVDVLEESDWAGQSIPICPVWGEEVLEDGKRTFRSLTRDARDPQMMLNYWRSAATELVALAPRVPFLVHESSLPEDPVEAGRWETANSQSHAYLLWRGQNIPQRMSFAGLPAGAVNEGATAADDMKATTGIFDAALGARGNETSGKAIMARQREADVGTFHYVDNLARAIQYGARVLIEVIPSIYSERQTITILGQDEAEKVVRLARTEGVPPTPEDPDGKLYDIRTGKYDVTVKVGPSYATQREETVQALMELIRSFPQAAGVLGDLLVKSMDWPGADEAAKRVRLMQMIELVKVLPVPVMMQLPPSMRDLLPAEVRAALTEMAQMAPAGQPGLPAPAPGAGQPAPQAAPPPGMPLQ